MSGNGFSLSFQLAGTDQTRTNAAAHAFFERNFTEHIRSVGKVRNCTEHRLRAAGINGINLLGLQQFLQRFCDQPMPSDRSVIGAENRFCTSSLKRLL